MLEEEDNFENFGEDDQPVKKEGVVEEIILDQPKFEDSYYYPADYREKIREESNMPAGLIGEVNNIGIPFSQRRNFFFVSDDELVYSSGNNFHIFNINTLERKSFPCTDIKGIGCITVSNDKKYIAVGECGYFPNIIIYEYSMNEETKQKEVRLYRILRRGTENAFTALCFNEERTYLASTGSDPDHNLIIWNWRTESIILKAKAFSQEVFSVCFSDNFEGKLITSGMGHIKFWEMAKTFTGLKLQGELGKFGQVDLSNVRAYLEFPDGKILCGTEQGTILLWEGIFIKTQIYIEEDVPCHGTIVKKEKSENKENKEDDEKKKESEIKEGEGGESAKEATENQNATESNREGKEESNSKVQDGAESNNNNNENATDKTQSKENQEPSTTSEKNKPKKEKETYKNLMLECMFWEGQKTIITAGHDGSIKWWNYNEMENAEIDDYFRSFIKPIKTEQLINPMTGGPVKILDIKPNYHNSEITCFLNKEEKEGVAKIDPNNLFWIIHDGNGFIYKIKVVIENEISVLKDLNVLVTGFTGNISCAHPLDNTPYILTQGADAKLSLVNNLSPENFDEKIIGTYNNIPELSATVCFVLTPISESEDPLIILTGFNTGLIRVHQYSNKNKTFDLVNQIKVHDKPVSFLKVSPDRSWLLSASEKDIFIQLIQTWNNITPLFFITKENGFNDIEWQTNSKDFLVALNDGSVEQISVQTSNNNSADTYEITEYEYKKFYLRNSYAFIDAIDDKKKKKFKEKEEHCKGKVYSVKSAAMNLEDDFFVTCAEPYNDFIFLCSFDYDKIPNNEVSVEDRIYVNLRPTLHWHIPKPKLVNTRILGGYMPRSDDIKYLKNQLQVKLLTKDLLIVANMNGTGIVQIHNRKNLSLFIELYVSPANNNKLYNAFCYNNSPIINLSFSNGTIVSYIVDLDAMNSFINFHNLNYTTMKNELKDDFNEEEYEKKLKKFISSELLELSKSNQENVVNMAKRNYPKKKEDSENFLKQYISLDIPTVNLQDYKTLEMFLEMRSLEKIKKDAELEAKQKKADEKKNLLREKIEKLREDFKSIFNKNNESSEEVKMLPEEMIVDDNFIESIHKTIEDNLDDVRHKYDWFKAIEQGTINRLEEFFLKSVKTHVIKLFTLSRKNESQYVTTIRCPSLAMNFDEAYSNLEGVIEDYKSKINFESLENEYFKHMQNNDGSEVVKEDVILSKIGEIKARIDDFVAKTDNKSGERVNFGKDQIKSELDINITDLKDLEHFKKNFDKAKHQTSTISKRGTMIDKKLKCPDRYTLKINYDVFYTEELMKTTFEHKLDMLNFLRVLYDTREEFNNELLKLRNKKIKIIQQARINKQTLISINNDLGIRSISEEDLKMGYENTGKYQFAPDTPTENLDWLNLDMKDEEYLDNLFRIKPEELENYALEKFKTEKNPTFNLNVDEGQENNNINNKPNQNESNMAFPYNGGNFNIPQIPVYNELKLNFKDRGTKKFHDSVLSKKMKEINQIKLNYNKKKVIEESVQMIENFDKEIRNLRKRKLDTHFRQKLGELELFIKHEEYNILRAFETDDHILIEKLEELSQQYRNNLTDLNHVEVVITELDQKLKQKKAEREEKIEEFYKFIETEKENKSKLEKIYFTKVKKTDGKDDGGLDNEEEIENDRPKNVTPTMYNEILLKRETRENLDSTIEGLEKSIEGQKKSKQNRIQTKLHLDKKREDIRVKINLQERKKSRYLNLIEISFPIKCDQFCKFIGGDHNVNELKLSLDISKAILISRNKLRKLDEFEDTTNVDIEQYKVKENKINANKSILDKAKRQARVEEKLCRENFIKEQNLKFGTEINFENLLKAARDTTGEKLDEDYKKLKREADLLLDGKKELEEALKREYQNEINLNTALLHKIKKLLNDNKQYDRSLAEKNNEINQRKEKTYELFNVHEKKEKLKEILKLLQQQMEALKKENEIFRKKGGHIYSTITSNLN